MNKSGKAGSASLRWLAGFAVSALAVRLLSWHGVFRGGRVLLIDGDDYYHLRRMMTAAADFPRLPTFDRYLAYPAGFHVIWPSLYDQLAGGLVRLFAGRAPDLKTAETVAAFIAPAAGALTVAAFYRAGREAVGERPARWAAALAVVLPTIVGYTLLGRPDHHCFENLWFPAALPLLLELMEGRGRRLPAAAAGAAVLLALGVSFWIGSIIFSVIFASAAAWQALSAAPRDRGGTPWAGTALLLEAALLSPYAFRGWSGELRFDAPTAFQPLLLFVLGLALCGLHWRGRSSSRRAAACGAAAFLCAALLVWGGTRFVAGFIAAPPVFRLFSEMQPLLAQYGSWGDGALFDAFGLAFWLLPAVLVLFARETEASAAKRVVLCWLAVTGALALAQSRYLYHFCFPAALLLGWGAERAAAECRRRLAKGPVSGPRASRAAVAAVLAALLAAPLRSVAGIAFCAPEDLTGDMRLIEACDWIRLHTPPARSLWDDQGTPEYGVYSLHSIGHQIAAVAQRPAAAGNWHTMPGPIMDSIAFFFMVDEEEGYRFLRSRGYRYLLVSDLVGERTLPVYGRLFGRPGYELTRREDGSMALSPAAMRFLYMRLYHLNGSAVPGAASSPALEHFRLVYESPNEPGPPDRYKVFELVEGARLSGPCRPGAVGASVPIEAGGGEKILYRAETACRDGSFALRVPFAGAYAISTKGSRSIRVVTESEVLNGG